MASETSGKMLKARRLEEDALSYRLQGISYRGIAAILQVNPQTAFKAVKRVMARQAKRCGESVEMLKDVQNRQINAMIEAHWQFVEKGDPKSSMVVLNCWKRQADLLGLDSPKKVQEVQEEDIDAQLDRLIERARRKAVESSGQVPITVEVDCTPQPIAAIGPGMVELATNGGSRIRQDAVGRGGGILPGMREQELADSAGGSDLPGRP